MNKLVRLLSIAFLLYGSSILAQEQPASGSPDPARVFITDSQSWSVAGASGGSGGSFAGHMAGGARPQTAEIIKTFGERCPQVKVNNIQDKADYIVVLDHEGGKGAFSHKNKVAVFARVSGDSIVSKSTVSLGGSVQDACEAITKDWGSHGNEMRAAAGAQNKPPDVAAPASSISTAPSASTAKLTISSIPDGADIEIDGSFVGNAPSEVQVPEGEHTVSVKKAGYANWERKLKTNSGSNIRLNAELQKVPQ